MNGGASTTDFTATGNTVLGNATTTALFATTASTTNFFGAGLTLCQGGNVLTWASGRFGCAADQSGVGGSAWPFTPSANYGVAVQSTSTPLWATAGLMASSTSYFVNASSTAFTVSGTAFFGTATSTTLNSNSATIGSLTAGTLSLSSLGTFAGGFLSQASSTVAGLLTALNSSSSLATLGTLWLPNVTNALLSTDSAGKLVATSTPTAASFIATSVIASLFPYASSTAFTVSGTGYFGLGAFTSTTGTTTIASGQGFTVGGSQFVVQQGSGNVGIGTTNPWSNLSVQARAGQTNPVFEVASSSNGTPFFRVDHNGNVSVAGSGVFTNSQQNIQTISNVNQLNSGAMFNGWWGGGSATEALVGAMLVPSSATVFQTNAVSGYIKSERSAVGTGGEVAGFFVAEAAANDANVFGINPVCLLGSGGYTGVKCQNEFDFNINSNGAVVTGISMQLTGTATSLNNAVAFAAAVPSGMLRWNGILYSGDGTASDYFIYGGAVSTTSNSASQPIVLAGKDPGGVSRPTRIYSDPYGNLVARGGQAGAVFAVQEHGGSANVLTAGTAGIHPLPT